MWDIKRLLNSCIEEQKRLEDSAESGDAVVLPVSEYGMGFSSFETGRIIAVNNMFSRIIGVSEREVRQLTNWEITPSYFHDRQSEVFDDLKRDGQYLDFSKLYRHADGLLVPVNLQLKLIEFKGSFYIFSVCEHPWMSGAVKKHIFANYRRDYGTVKMAEIVDFVRSRVVGGE